MTVGSGTNSGKAMYVRKRELHCAACSAMVGQRLSWRKTSSVLCGLSMTEESYTDVWRGIVSLLNRKAKLVFAKNMSKVGSKRVAFDVCEDRVNLGPLGIFGGGNGDTSPGWTSQRLCAQSHVSVLYMLTSCREA